MRWSARARARRRAKAFRKKLRAGELNDKEIEIEVQAGGGGMPMFEIPGMPGAQMGAISIGDIFGKLGGGRTKTRRVTVEELHDILINEESDKLLDKDQLVQEAITRGRAERHRLPRRDRQDRRPRGPRGRRRVARGRAARSAAADRRHHRLDQARPGEDRPHPVHRVGRVPPLQAVGPAARAAGPAADPRRAASALTRDDFRRILTEPEASLIKQYVALMATEGVTLEFTDDAIDAIADVAVAVNSSVENIGARRLQTVMERVLDEISFAAPDRSGETVKIDAAYVQKHIGDLAKNADLSRFIL